MRKTRMTPDEKKVYTHDLSVEIWEHIKKCSEEQKTNGDAMDEFIETKFPKMNPYIRDQVTGIMGVFVAAHVLIQTGLLAEVAKEIQKKGDLN